MYVSQYECELQITNMHLAMRVLRIDLKGYCVRGEGVVQVDVGNGGNEM